MPGIFLTTENTENFYTADRPLALSTSRPFNLATSCPQWLKK